MMTIASGGGSVCSLGDFDGDGVGDLVAGADWAQYCGVLIMLLTDDHEVRHRVKIGPGSGGFTGDVELADFFGCSVTSLGDLDGDGVTDIAAGAYKDNDGGMDRGAVYIIFLNPDGTVKSHQKISDYEGGFTGVLDDYDQFGFDLAYINDLDQDGVGDLAVSANGDDDGGSNRGAVWILFLNTDGTVKAYQKISSTEGSFSGALEDGDTFGSALACFDDLNGDGLEDLAVGADNDHDTCDEQGSVWILFLWIDGTVSFHQKISATEGGFTGSLVCGGRFGASAAVPGDIDGDAVDDLVVGAPYDDLDGGIDRGDAWVLLMNTNGTVKAHQRISDAVGGFTGVLDDEDHFAKSTAALGDIDGNGVPDVVFGAPWDDDGHYEAGALWQLALSSTGTVNAEFKISDTEGGVPGLADYDAFGSAVADIGDLDNDGNSDLVVGAYGDSDDGADKGAVYVLFLDEDEVFRRCQKISGSEGGLTGPLHNLDYFGMAACALGDLDGYGVEDVVVGSPGDNDGGAENGAVYVLFLNIDGTVKSEQKISETAGGFTGDLNLGRFGTSIASLGDLDGDEISDIAVGAPEDNDGASHAGAVWVLFLNANGTVKSYQKISATEGGFTGLLDGEDLFGTSAAYLGDLDGDGVADLAVSATMDDDGATDAGALWILFLNSNGTVKSHQKISGVEGGFTGDLDHNDKFGSSIVSIGDYDADGIADLAVGARGDDDGDGSNMGAVWLLYLRTDGTVRAYEKISSTEGDLADALGDGDGFGSSVALVGDRDGDGTGDIVVGASGDDDGASNCGSAYGLYLERPVPVCSVDVTSIRLPGPVAPGAYRDTTFNITNTGRLVVEGVVSEISDQFNIVSGEGPYSLATSETLTVTVRYEPATRGEHTCTVDLGGSLCSDVTLTGVSRYPSPVLCATPPEIDLGIVPLGLSRDTLLTVFNAGADTLRGDVQETCDHYSIAAGGGPFSLAAGESLDVQLHYEPDIEGWHYCTVGTGDTLMEDIACLAGGSGGFMVLDIADSSNPVILGSIDSPGTAYQVDIGCGYAFMADGSSGMQVYDVADPTLPAWGSISPAVANAYDVAIRDGYAYVASGSKGLKVVDVTNAAAPVVIGTCNTAYSLNAVAVADGRVYATYQKGLYVIDVSDPESPAVLGSYFSMASDHYDVAVAGDYAYTVGSSFKVFDVSNPSNPWLKDYITLTGDGSGIDVQGDHAYLAWGASGIQVVDISAPGDVSIVGHCDTPGTANDVCVRGGLAYVAGSTYLRILDVSNPLNPVIVGTRSLPGFYAQGVSVNTGIPLIARAVTGRPVCQVEPNPLDFGKVNVGEWDTRILTITNAGEGLLSGNIVETCDCFSLVMGGGFSLGPGQSRQIAVTFQPAEEDTYTCTIRASNTLCGPAGFVADGDSGLVILNVEDPSAPSLVGQVDTPGSARGLDIDTSWAYVGDWDEGMQVIDFVDPANPVVVANFEYTGFGRVNDVEVVGDYAYVANYSSFTSYSGLRIIDIGDPENPSLTGSYNTPSRSYELEIRDDHAYVADDESGLQVISIVDPANPTPAAACDTPGRANGIGLLGGYAYIADGDSGLQVVDISDPLSPSIVGTCATPDSAVGIAIDSPYVFIADCGSGLQVVDVTNPAVPVHIGSFDTPGTAEGVDVVGAYAYVADGDSGIQVVDITNPASPEAVGKIRTPGHAYGVLATGGIECVGIGQGLSGIDGTATEFRLSPGQPNPCRSGTLIRFSIDRRARVSLKIYDASGRLVGTIMDRTLDPGFYLETWDGRNATGREIPSGVYFCRLVSGHDTRVEKIIVIR